MYVVLLFQGDRWGCWRDTGYDIETVRRNGLTGAKVISIGKAVITGISVLGAIHTVKEILDDDDD